MQRTSYPTGYPCAGCAAYGHKRTKRFLLTETPSPYHEHIFRMNGALYCRVCDGDLTAERPVIQHDHS